MAFGTLVLGAEEMTSLQGGLQPHSFCLPILKRERHRQAVAAAAMSGSKKFFLGTDSAPHARETKVRPARLQANWLMVVPYGCLGLAAEACTHLFCSAMPLMTGSSACLLSNHQPCIARP